MEYIRKVKITINGEKFDNIKESLEQLKLLTKDNDCKNNIEIYIDTNKTTYEEKFMFVGDAIDYIEDIILWTGA